MKKTLTPIVIKSGFKLPAWPLKYTIGEKNHFFMSGNPTDKPSGFKERIILINNKSNRNEFVDPNKVKFDYFTYSKQDLFKQTRNSPNSVEFLVERERKI